MLAYLDATPPTAPGCYLLVPVSKRIRKHLMAITGEESILYQVDSDFPHLAAMLGWKGEGISEAANWLDSHDGIVRRVDSEVFGI